MPLIVIKLLEDDAAADMKAAIDAYIAGAGSALATDQRGMALAAYFDPQSDKHRSLVALAHGGLDIPASKTADQQFVMVEGDSLSEVQTALNTALSDVVHATVTDADTTTPGTVTSATGPFAAEDVGRKMKIDDEVRTITAFTSANSVDYDDAAEGAFTSGSGLTLDLLGAEVLQKVEVAAYRERDGDPHYAVLAALEGQIA